MDVDVSLAGADQLHQLGERVHTCHRQEIRFGDRSLRQQPVGSHAGIFGTEEENERWPVLSRRSDVDVGHGHGVETVHVEAVVDRGVVLGYLDGDVSGASGLDWWNLTVAGEAGVEGPAGGEV